MTAKWLAVTILVGGFAAAAAADPVSSPATGSVPAVPLYADAPRPMLPPAQSVDGQAYQSGWGDVQPYSPGTAGTVSGDARPPLIRMSLPAAGSSRWGGFYVGGHIGGVLGVATVSDPYGASIYGDQIRSPGFMAGMQAGYNWQPIGSFWVFGLEADGSWLDVSGGNTCFASSGTITSSTCRARPDFSGTLTGRVGYAFGEFGQTLAYVKGGGAVLHNRIEATTNYGFGVFPITTTNTSPMSLGWTVGAGVERALSPAWSVKLEYDYLNFGSTSLSSPATFSVSPPFPGLITPVAGVSTSVRQSINEVKIGLNYKIGENGWSQIGLADRVGSIQTPTMIGSGWEIEPGLRYWYSSGSFEKSLPSGVSSSSSLISRLTYDGMTANSGEIFARIDSPWRLFLKGFVGLGGITNGHMNDEDWGLSPPASGAFTGYSNTYSSASTTAINYGTIDLGFDFLKGPWYKFGVFAGFNSVYEQYAVNNCNQIASPSSGICAPAISGLPIITETDRWNSVRAGFSTEFWVDSKWKISGDVAYLPYVKFTGTDNHWLRSLVFDESGTGKGVQTEAMLSYYVTPQFSLGAGARYWAMWTTSGTDSANGALQTRTDTYRYERYGMLLQATYRFGGPGDQRAGFQAH